MPNNSGEPTRLAARMRRTLEDAQIPCHETTLLDGSSMTRNASHDDQQAPGCPTVLNRRLAAGRSVGFRFGGFPSNRGYRSPRGTNPDLLILLV
jgi:hypothetical protein